MDVAAVRCPVSEWASASPPRGGPPRGMMPPVVIEKRSADAGDLDVDMQVLFLMILRLSLAIAVTSGRCKCAGQERRASALGRRGVHRMPT